MAFLGPVGLVVHREGRCSPARAEDGARVTNVTDHQSFPANERRNGGGSCGGVFAVGTRERMRRREKRDEESKDRQADRQSKKAQGN